LPQMIWFVKLSTAPGKVLLGLQHTDQAFNLGRYHRARVATIIIRGSPETNTNGKAVESL
jgi:hypothetical protein